MRIDEVAAEEDGIGPERHDAADEAPRVPVALQGSHVDIGKEGQPDRRDCLFRLNRDVTDGGVDGFIDAPGHDGEDQKQHVELTRDVAQRFNNLYGETFKVPEPWIPKVGARVMDLLDPRSKMSKSDEVGNGRVCLMDDPADIMRKFKRAVTDSESGAGCVRFDPEEKPGVANLMQIYAACTGKSFAEIEQEFASAGYGVFKPAVGEAVVETLRPIREEATRIMKDKAYLNELCRSGAEKASYIANKTLRKVYKKVGLVAPNF